MARKLVTQELVNAVADEIVAEGKEPTLVDVQARIGGSYTSIKKCLDHWQQQRSASSEAAASLPTDVIAKGQELVRAIWMSASQSARREAKEIADKAVQDAASMRDELSQAMNEITRLERIEAQLTGLVEQQQVRLRDVELALAESNVQAARAGKLESTLTHLRGKCDLLQQEAAGKAEELGRKHGEAETLRAQMSELMRALKARKS